MTTMTTDRIPADLANRADVEALLRCFYGRALPSTKCIGARSPSAPKLKRRVSLGR